MVLLKYLLIASIYFVEFHLSKAGNSMACTLGGNECTGTLKCVTISAASACVEPCTSDADCGGTAGSCSQKADINGNTANKFCPLATKECLSDAECSTKNAALPTCDLFTLTCVAASTNNVASTTVSSTTVNTTTIATTTTASAQPSTPACADQVVGGSNDCASLAAYCKNDVYLSLMKEKCPKTCGYCTTSSSSGSGSGSSGSGTSGSGSTGSDGCVDKVVGGSNDCASMASYCKNVIYKSLMKKQCPKTCGYCTSSSSSSPSNNSPGTSSGTSSGGSGSGTCTNTASDCSSRSYLCKNTIYKDLMKKVCASTCGYC